MSTELVYKLLAEMAQWHEPFFISPFKVNEPFLDPRLEALCIHIEKTIPRATLRLFTNGSPLTDQQLDWVHDLTNLDCLWISLNEVVTEEYERLMSLKWEQTSKRLDNLHARMLQNRFKQAVTVSRVAGHPDADRHFIRYVGTRWPQFRPFLIKRDAWIDFTHSSDSIVPHAPCGRWWELSVMATGTVALCCMDGTGEFALGDVATHSLDEIYNQPHLVRRRQLAHDRIGINPCERCTY